MSRTGKTESLKYDIIGLDNIKLVSGVCNLLGNALVIFFSS